MIEPKVFTIDFDNTCAFEEYPNIGDDVPFAEWALKTIQKDGHKLILWTCRIDKELEDAVNWFKKRDIKLDGVNDYIDKENNFFIQQYGECRKVIGDFNIDDRNLGCPTKIYVNSETNKEYKVVDWSKIIEELTNLKLLS